MTKNLPDYTTKELLAEVLARADHYATTISTFADLFIMMGKITVEHPDLYQTIVKEMINRKSP
jgi:tellurite resistance-related uncharacterized protein